MSRKLTRHGQNDISITRNLPEQEKSGKVPDIGSKTTEFVARNAERGTSLGKVIKNSHMTSECDVPTVAIPGILRLNGSERARLTKGQRNKSKDCSSSHKIECVPKNVLRLKNELHDNGASPDPVSSAKSFISKKYPVWFDDAQLRESSVELRELYDTLTGLIQQNAVLQHWHYLMETRKHLQVIFKQIVLQHLKLCCEMKCDNFFWKLLFYNVREFLRYSSVQGTHEYVLELIEDGVDFYKDLIKCLKDKFLSIEQKLHNYGPENAHNHKSEKFEFIATFVAQKLLICLGDLFRYKTKQLQSNDFNEAAQCYREAQLLIPTNGIPYNQLAIVAIHDRKKFEAVYLHMRSLMSSNAIQSAKESLLGLFDEISKKFEKTEQKISPVHQYKSASATSFSGKVISPLRKEVWIYPDGVRRLHRTDVKCRRKLNKPAKNVELRLDEMPTEDLLQRFISIYLYVIGKLYTGIGMETIQAHQTKLLTQLSALLKKNVSPLIITRSKLLKMVALNIFILHHNLQQDSRREIRYYTFTFINQMFGLILQKCNQLMTEFRESENLKNPVESESLKNLNSLLQFIKIYTDYLGLIITVWEPIRSEEQYFIDPWIELQALFEHIEHILDEHRSNNDTEFILEENNFFYGFTPLKTLQSKRFLIQTSSSELAQFFARIKHIQKFQLCFSEHLDRLQIEENDANSSFVLEELNTDIKSALETLHNETSVCNDDMELDIKNETKLNVRQNKSANDLRSLQSQNDANNASIAHLAKLKKELEQQNNAKRLYNTKLEEILKFVDTKVYMEVRPKYLMPDTNCFIDCLDDFEKLLKDYKRYTLVIPLTVVRELDGLSKGIKMDSRSHSMQKHRIHHFDDVSTMAKKSLDFIKNAKQNVKCATSKGSIINASLFALVEEEYMSNDDRILATAVALSKTMCRETSKDEKCFIQTELVLITTDRNLRVKALSRNLAVSELDEFLLWAQECNHA